MFAGAVSKTVASCVAYPHEVARTRLREDGNKYRSFWQTIWTVWKEEGRFGLYRLVLVDIYFSYFFYLILAITLAILLCGILK